MTSTIQALVERNIDILRFLDRYGRDYQNADKIFAQFQEKLEESRFNAALTIDFANICQSLNVQENFAPIDLDDIGRLFASLIQLEEFNLDAYVEYANFEWAVQDNSQSAREIAKLGLEKAQAKVAELELLLQTIDSE